MKPPVPDDRQTLEELRRIFDADELPVPDRLRPENLLPTLLAEKPALPIYRQRWFRPAIATAAAAAVVLLLVLPVWDRLAAPSTSVSQNLTCGTSVQTDTTEETVNQDDESAWDALATEQAPEAETGEADLPAGAEPTADAAKTEPMAGGAAPSTTSSCVLSGTSTSEMTFEDAKCLLDGGALLFDLRSEGEASVPLVAGAVNIPLSDLDERIRLEADPSQSLILYATDKGQLRQAADQLTALGYKEVYMLESLS